MNKKLWSFLLLMTCFLLASYSACAQANDQVVPSEVAYGSHPLQTLDIYLSSPGAPTIVLVHGGGFARGDKRRPFGTMLFEHIRGVLLGAGYNIVAINYRLSADTITVPPQHPYDFKFPAAHEDVLAAAKWVHDNGQAYGLSWPVGVVGESAGGNLGTYLAMNPSVRACGLMDVGGYPDLPAASSPNVIGWASNYIGCSYEECPDSWSGASALRQPGVPVPALLWHGDADTLVDYAQTYGIATRISQLAQAAGIPAPLTTARTIPGAGHTGLPGFATDENDAEILSFFWTTCQQRQ